MKIFLLTDQGGIIAGAALMTALAGCVAEGPGPRSGYQSRPAVQVQATVAFQDDYDYYPGYETYYSRSRHEFVYRDGNTWVRRPAPQGVSVSVLLAAPSVHMDFRDSPEQHHNSVVQSYPRNWAPPGKGPAAKDDRRVAPVNNHQDVKVEEHRESKGEDRRDVKKVDARDDKKDAKDDKNDRKVDRNDDSRRD